MFTARRYSGHGPPRLPQRALDGLRLRALARLERDLTVADGSGPPLCFRSRSIFEYNRATNALHNEPGTLRWLREGLREGDVFYDVGANIGVFSLVAAHAVGAEGRVIAFEPHAATVEALLHNVACNGLRERVDVVSSALYSTTGYLPFLYRSLVPGSDFSQVGATRDPFGNDVAPSARELKAVAAVDDLLAAGTLPPPDLVKIDVDGAEREVLQGMRGVLGRRPPRSLQVEVNPDRAGGVHELMRSVGFIEKARHLTLGSERRVREGTDPSTLGANVIFERQAA